MGERSAYRRNSSGAFKLVAVIVLAPLFLGIGSAAAGPPFLTDDPETVAFRHWEVYVGSQGVRDDAGWSGTAPHVEVNYGPIPNVQLHVIAPLVLVAPDRSRSTYGYGDTELGIKVRFLKTARSQFQVGTFPSMEIPSGNASIGTGGGDAHLFLPLWIQRSWGPWTTDAGAGYWTGLGDSHQHWWFLGWETQRRLTRAVTAGGEVFHQTSTDEGQPEWGFNLGMIFDLSELHHILLSAGRDFDGPNELQTYIAYQITLGP